MFEGKNVLITGATGNLGSAVVSRFAADGARLILVDRDTARLEALIGTLDNNPVSMYATTDVTDPAAVDALVAQVENDSRFGSIDILAHTVGGFAMGRRVADADALEQLDRMLLLNVRPIVVLCGRVARHMTDNGIAGHITVVVARAALKGAAQMGAYTASKAAALRLVESLALEVRDAGVHVNAVSPSTIDTPPNRAEMPNADFARWVTPAQIADTIAFLSSPAGGAFYGANLEVYARA